MILKPNDLFDQTKNKDKSQAIKPKS